MKRFGVVALLFGATIAVGCSTEQPARLPTGDTLAPEISVPTAPVGRIRGVVRFQGDLPAPEFEPIAKDQDVCGDMASLPRLDLGADNGVRHAFVYLDGVDASPPPPPVEPVLVDQVDCEYLPHALVVPLGTQVDVTNSDSILHNVHGRAETGGRMRTIFNIAQPVQGQRTTINSPLDESGIIVMSCEAGHPWMKAHVFVADHPYATVTDDAGGFVIENVPPGTYTIKMWHEGVRLTRIIRNLQRFDYEEPYEITLEVTVEADTETVIDFDMALRPEEA